MKAITVILLLGAYLPSNISAQNYRMTFSGTGESTVVDSVTAKNLTTGASITLPGNGTLVLAISSGVDDLVDRQTDAVIYPNPMNGSGTLSLCQPRGGDILVTVRNMFGQEIARLKMVLDAGGHSFQVSPGKSGIYLIDITGPGLRDFIKVICIEAQDGRGSLTYLGATNRENPSEEGHRNKSNSTDYFLAYNANNVMQYLGKSGTKKTVVLDVPAASKNYEFDFSGCVDRSGRSYQVIKVADQVWMAENLAYLPNVYAPGNVSSTSRMFYVYGADSLNVTEAKATENYKTYGVLYNWPAAMYACPSGWYLPQKADWSQLLTSVRSDPASRMFYSPKGGEMYPFISGYLGLYVYPDFRKLDTLATYWSSSQKELSLHPGEISAWLLSLSGQTQSTWVSEYEYGMTHYYYPSQQTKQSGHSVRCIKGVEPTVPTVVVKEITSVRQTSVELTGEVTSEGGGGLVVTSRGFCWSRNPAPTIENDHSVNGSGSGTFNWAITGLLSATDYYIRAFAVNERGTAYSETQKVTTVGGVARLMTTWLGNITDTSAYVRGQVLSDGGLKIDKIGFCWSLINNPTTNDHVVYNTIFVRDTFYCTLSGFAAKQTVFIKPFVTNEMGTTYGDVQQFITADGSFKYEGEVYGYSAIGEQTWMNQNLRYLPFVMTDGSVDKDTPMCYVYDYNGSDIPTARQLPNYRLYGVLYNPPAAMNGAPYSDLVPSGIRGICPPGWHLPSGGEFEKLLNFIGGTNKDLLKSQFDWDSIAKNGSPNSLFNALPAGNVQTMGSEEMHRTANFWSTSKIDPYPSGYGGLGFLRISDMTYLADWGFEWDGMSVRCIMDIGGNTKPIAGFKFTPEAVEIGEECHFDPKTSYDSQTEASRLLFRWDWNGDGVWDTDQHGLLDYTNSFAQAGNYKVILEVEDEGGAVDTTSQIITVCEGRFVDSRDNISYLFVQIGQQQWMAENLKYLPAINNVDESSKDQPKYYVNGYYVGGLSDAKQSPNYQAYGALYNWSAAQNACPAGWHLPSDEEWKQLEKSLGMSTSEAGATGWRRTGQVGKKLKTVTGWKNSGTAPGSNESRFMAKAAGQRMDSYGISYGEPGTDCDFWTSTAKSSDEAYQRRLISTTYDVYRVSNFKRNGFSVRCVKDR